MDAVRTQCVHTSRCGMQHNAALVSGKVEVVCSFVMGVAFEKYANLANAQTTTGRLPSLRAITETSHLFPAVSTSVWDCGTLCDDRTVHVCQTACHRLVVYTRAPNYMLRFRSASLASRNINSNAYLQLSPI